MYVVSKIYPYHSATVFTINQHDYIYNMRDSQQIPVLYIYMHVHIHSQ